MERQALREHRELERQHKQLVRDQKQAYQEQRTYEVEDLNLNLEEKLDLLKSVLVHTLSVDDAINFQSLFPEKPTPSTYSPERPKPPPLPLEIGEPFWFEKLLPGWEKRYQQRLQERSDKIKRFKAEYEAAVCNYEYQLAAKKTGDEAALRAYEQRIAEIEEFEKAYQSGDASAISSYNSMVLERSEYPDGFPQKFQVAYVPESKEIVIDYEFPPITVVPTVEEYKYVKSKDEIQTKSKKDKEVKELYKDIILSITLRTIHEVIEADQRSHLDTITFSGYIESIDPATGKEIKPYLISIRTSKDKFSKIDLERIDKAICLRDLGAQVSSNPKDIVPVKPIVNFNMYDKRFVEHDDILQGLDKRTNLYELNPFEFENLIRHLFEKMGFESKLTRSSKDGGVDVIAFDPRPILGGKVVIQAKRYKNTVGVSDVRDLWGTMDHERAHKGILITTSGFGPDAYKFADSKPMELIDGGGLIYLLSEVGIDARIQFPAEVPSKV